MAWAGVEIVTPDERLEAAARKWADTVNAAIETRVQLALALERERHDADIDSLTRRVDNLTAEIDGLRAAYRNLDSWLIDGAARHSVRMEP